MYLALSVVGSQSLVAGIVLGGFAVASGCRAIAVSRWERSLGEDHDSEMSPE